jgi:hypothetical protein
MRKVFEELNAKLKIINKEKLDSEEQLQIEKEKRLELERQNNYLRVANL